MLKIIGLITLIFIGWLLISSDDIGRAGRCAEEAAAFARALAEKTKDLLAELKPKADKPSTPGEREDKPEEDPPQGLLDQGVIRERFRKKPREIEVSNPYEQTKKNLLAALNLLEGQ